MSKKHSKSLTATTMRYILSASLVLVIAAMAGGFYVAYSYLGSYADVVAETQLEASASETQLSYLQNLQKQLDEHRATMDKATKIVADAESYRYQDQVITELTRHAETAGVKIMSFSFNSADSSSGAAAGAQQTAPATTGAPTEEQPAGADSDATTTTPGAATVASTTVMVSLSTEVPYRNLLHFLYLIEENLTRMQIAELSLTPNEGGTISTNTLNIEVFIQ